MKFLKSTLAGTRFLGSSDASGFEAAETGGHTTRGTETYSQKPHMFQWSHLPSLKLTVRTWKWAIRKGND